MKPPLVSVIVPAYNAAAFVGEALRSALSQTYPHLEVIVVDDGSTDETSDLVQAIAREDARVVLIRQQNAGVARARNAAIERASGEFIAPLDADDIWYPRKLELQVRHMLDAGPEVGLVYAWWTIIDAAGRISIPSIKPCLEGHVSDALLRSNFIGNASVPLIRRSCIEKLGGYNTAMKAQGGQGCEDWDLALRISERYAFGVVRTCLLGYRKVEGAMSSNAHCMARSYETMLEEARRRRPDLTPRLLNHVRSGFFRYLARTCFIEGKHADALRWLYKALGLDLKGTLQWRPLVILATSLPLLLLSPLSALLWPKRTTWLRLRRASMRLRGYDLDRDVHGGACEGVGESEDAATGSSRALTPPPHYGPQVIADVRSGDPKTAA